MAITQAVQDRVVAKLNGIAAAGGTATVTVAVPTDYVLMVWAKVLMARNAAGHNASSAGLLATCVARNNNATAAFPAALVSSANPDNSGGLVGAGAEASDLSAAPTANWTVSSPNVVLTVTNNDAANVVDATAFLDLVETSSV